MIWFSSLMVQSCYCAVCSELEEIMAVLDAELFLVLPPLVWSNNWCRSFSPEAVESQNIETLLVSEGCSLVAKLLSVFFSIFSKATSLLVLCSSIQRYVCVLLLSSPFLCSF